MEGDLTRGGKHGIQYIDNVLENFTPEIYIIFINQWHPNEF